MNEIPHGDPLPPDVLDQATIGTVRRRLFHELTDWVRNAQRSLDCVVREQTQGDMVDLDHVRDDTDAALIAIENAIGELQAAADTLKPYARADARERERTAA